MIKTIFALTVMKKNSGISSDGWSPEESQEFFLRQFYLYIKISHEKSQNPHSISLQSTKHIKSSLFEK